jgi:hypothetical protein
MNIEIDELFSLEAKEKTKVADEGNESKGKFKEAVDGLFNSPKSKTKPNKNVMF